MGINDSAFAQLGLDVITQFGESATYTPVSGSPVSCIVHLDTEVAAQPDGFSVQARGAELTIEALVAQIGSSVKVRRASGTAYAAGDMFTIGSQVYEVVEILEEDSVYIKMAVRKVDGN